MPAGINFREGKKGENFRDLNPFLLHDVKKGGNISQNLIFEMTPQ